MKVGKCYYFAESVDTGWRCLEQWCNLALLVGNLGCSNVQKMLIMEMVTTMTNDDDGSHGIEF